MNDDEMIEAMARAICRFENRDPDEMTYKFDGGVPQPFRPVWKGFIDHMRAALDAIRPEIDRRIAEARNAALEEAANTVEQWSCEGYSYALRLRALKS